MSTENESKPQVSEDQILDRNPIHEFGAGQIGSQLHNESMGGKVIGTDFKKKQTEENFFNKQTSEAGLLTNAQDDHNGLEIIVKLLTEFLNHDFRSFNQKLFDSTVEIAIFMLHDSRSMYRGRNGIPQFFRKIFPFAKVIKSASTKASEGDLVLLPAFIAEYGENPEWTAWELYRRSNVGKENEGIEPPRFYGGINTWLDEYAIFNSPFEYWQEYKHSQKFIIPDSYITSLLDKEAVLNFIKEEALKLRNETK